MLRRDFIRLTGAAVAATAAPPLSAADLTTALMQRVRTARPRALPADPDRGGDLDLRSRWRGELCTGSLRNRGRQPVRIQEILFADFPHGLPPETTLYGESFQMLSQTAGTIARPVDLGYSELKHYKLPQPEHATALSGALMLTPPGERTLLAAFTSCRRFIGRFYLEGEMLRIILDAEGRELAPGEEWQLEECMLASGRASELTAALAERIAANHPHALSKTPPTGWCSWYCFGPRVTGKQVLDTLDVIAGQVPGLRYVQIDDGYQPAMGDWLETGPAFGGDVRAVLTAIRERGFEPAIWVAPFIGEEKSHLFQQHPGWFMHDAEGKPLASNRVTFGGWRRGPWYALDGTHPDAQKHLEALFRIMRQEWGCTYFKLDANFWGAMHGGLLHDPKATRIEAYRRGMEAIRRGAGDAFILGCNHPIWPSFGLIDGSRSSGDIKRLWSTFAKQARQSLSRNWQNGALWWNDPDAVLLTNPPPGNTLPPTLTDDEFQFHATATYASGGMVLSGDDLTRISPQRLAMLRKLLPPTGFAARFEDESLRVGWIRLPTESHLCLFNWDDAPRTLFARLPRPVRLRDFWNGEDFGRREGVFQVKDMPPHSARLLRCT